eukprot:1917075-Rhodomonas_salina.3
MESLKAYLSDVHCTLPWSHHALGQYHALRSTVPYVNTERRIAAYARSVPCSVYQHMLGTYDTAGREIVAAYAASVPCSVYQHTVRQYQTARSSICYVSTRQRVGSA